MKRFVLAWLALVALLLAGSTDVHSQVITPTNQIPLFNGTSLSGLYPWFSTSGFSDPNQIFRVENGLLRVTGNAWGALATNARYRNYVMVLEFKWGDETFGSRLGLAKDAGVLFHSNGSEGAWNGLLMPGIRAQMIEGGIGDVILLKGADPMSVTARIEQVASGITPPNWNYRGGYRWKAGNSPATFNQDVATVHWSGWDPNWQDVIGFRGENVLESPDGQWNQMVVVANNDTFEIYLNGTKINEGTDVTPSEGKIQLEVEFAEFFVRRWELWPLGHAVGPVITVEQLPSGAAGTAYNQTVRAAGGSTLTWSIPTGTLPPGLTLNPATGQISGAPTASGTFGFTVRVTDAAGGQANQVFQIPVSATSGALVTTGLVLHLDATQGVTATGNTVTAWADSSGNGNNVVAVNNPQRGTVLTPTGLQSIRLDGVDDVLQRTAVLTNFPSGNANRTVFLVAKYNSSTWWAGVAYGTAAGNQAFGLNVKHPTGELVLHGYGGGNDLVSGTQGIDAGWLVQSALVNDGTATHFNDGVQIGQFAHTYNTVLSKLVIGMEIGNAGFVGMDVAALLVYDRALSASERGDVETYLQGRYLIDTVPPVITVPANIVAEATGASGAVVNFTTSAVDNASGSVATTNTPPSGSVFPLGVNAVTTAAADGSGNSAISSFTVTVRDTTAPAITVPAGVNVETSDSNGTIVNFSTSATDTVSGVVTPANTPASGSLFPVGTTTVTTTAVDAAGNSASSTFTVTVSFVPPGGSNELNTVGLVLHLDSTQGVTAMGNMVTAWADSSGNSNNLVAVNDPRRGTVLTPLGLPAISLDGVNDALQRTGTLNGFPSGNANRTIFMVAKYNSSTAWAGVAYGTASANQSFGLYVKHATGELVLHGNSSPNDLISTTPGIGAGWMVQSGLVNGGTGTLFKNGTQIGQFAHTYNTGLTKLAIGAEIGNLGYVGMDVAAVLIYNRALGASERADVDAYLRNKYLVDTAPPVVTVPANITTEATGSSGAVVNFSTSAIDVVSGVLTLTNTPASGSLFPLGTTTVTTAAVDGAGNSASRTFTVTVRDTTAPVITVPANIIAEATGSSGATVSFTTSASDIVNGAVTTTNSPVSGSLFALGTTTVTTTATDVAGNSATGTFTVTVRDTTAPVITVPANIIAEATGASGATVSFTTSASDIVNGAVTTTNSPVSGSVFALGTTTVTTTATDVAGNSASRTYTVTVRDTTAPVITVPANIIAEATGASGATVSFATSASDIVNGAVTTTNSPVSGSVFALGTTTVTTTATDVAGNSASRTFTVTVHDTTAPVITVPANIIAEATGGSGATVSFMTSASDTLNGSVTTTNSPVSGSVFALGTTTVTTTATDAAGNSATGTFTVTVRDTTAPMIAVPANIIVEAIGATGATVSFTTSASDIVNGAVTTTNSPVSGSVFALGTTTVTTTATDVAGNSATVTFTVTVRDTTAPVITVPANIIAEATGASGATVNFTTSASDIVNGAVTTTNSPVSGSVFALGTTTVTTTATDVAGNSATGTFTVTVRDTTAPVITVPANIIAEATGASGAMVSFTTSVSDIVNGAVPPTNSPVSGSVFALGTTTVTTTATDAAGNNATGTFTVTVRDTAAPAITVPANIIAEATGANGATVNFTTSANDLVSGSAATFSTPASGSLFPLGTTIVTTTAMDTAGNLASQTFTVTVQDTTAPTISVPANITVEATGSDGATVSFATSATDIVSGSVVTINTPASGSVFLVGATTVTATAVDAAGNSASGTFSVTVRDTTAPTISIPSDMIVEATSASGAVVNFATTATDIVSGSVATINSPASGSIFPLGATTVTATATDMAGNSANRTFTVTVRDTTAPVISVPNPGPLMHEAGAPFVDAGAIAIDAVGGVVALSSSTAVNGLVPGSYVLTYNFTDAALNAAAQVTVAVNVVDTVGPIITVPANLVVEATGAAGAVASFSTSATDLISGAAATTNTPASGSLFPIGITTVTAAATDALGNLASVTFTVTVRDTTAPVITVPNPGPLSHEVGTAFADPGATATDVVAGVVPLISSSFVNGLVPGSYVLTYNFSDAALNAAPQVTVTVNVVDTRTVVPGVISYQGRIAAGGANFDGTGLFKFAMLNSAGTATYWSNDGSSVAGSPPATAVSLLVTNGLYSLRLGDTALPNMRLIPATAFGSSDVCLRIWFNDGTNGWQQLAPDQRISAAGFAMRANSATEVDDGGITAQSFAGGAVLANLNASGQAGVPSGGVVFSINENPALENAGYIKVGVAIPDGTWQVRAWHNHGDQTSGASPAGRYFHTAVWTGTQMIVWGGKNDGAYFNDGARHDPVANSWTPVAAPGAPEARYLHTAVWTGSRMLVWGGLNPAGMATDVGRYDPGSDTWSSGSSVNAPVGRIFHTAVWTGTEMIVWGGADFDGNALNTGARYNPVTDTWTTISDVNAPGPRRSHTAVWTGTEMVVWGGTAPPMRHGDGKRYNPVSDTWTAVATVGAPAARSHHSAVWTGSEMIIWGGHDDSNYFDDVRRYNPLVGSWTTGASDGAPAGRDFHTAVWTGDEMLIWGGFGEGGLVNSGARYKPSDDIWNALDQGGFPPARWVHSAVWTGSDTIVWGGLGGSTGPVLKDLEIYGLLRTVLLYQRQ